MPSGGLIDALNMLIGDTFDAEGPNPYRAEVAGALGVEVEQVVEARAAVSAQRALWLDMPHETDEEEPAWEIAAEKLGFAAAEDAATLQRLAAGLSDREREVLWLRYREDLIQSEIAARAGATGLFGGDEITVHVTASRARDIAEDLRGVQSDVRDALRRHELPAVPVHVMLTGFERRTRRELD